MASAIQNAGTNIDGISRLPILRQFGFMIGLAATIAAAVLWLSGLAWLTLSNRILWLGWLQMSAAIALFIGSGFAKRRSE